MKSDGAAAACRTWLEAWNDVLRILDKTGIDSIHEFDDRFGETQSLFNWIQDLEDELWNAGLEDRQFLKARIAVCEEGLRRFPVENDLMTENRRRALAESYYELGETAKAEALYSEWLQTDPSWGWGWIGWSDCYRFTSTAFRDLKRFERLLQEGLSIAEVRDRPDLGERLADLLEEQGRDEEAKQVRRQAKGYPTAAETTLDLSADGRVVRQKTTITFGDEGLPLDEVSNLASIVRGSSSPATASKQKVGRNQPCPCGSGKKFKKCCGLSTA
jgi:tetratricopeptide (TPR) repeat protein